MDKYESFDLLLDHILATEQGHSDSVKRLVPFFKDIDRARIDLMFEEMYRIAPRAFIRKEFKGRPFLLLNEYTRLLKEDGGFKHFAEVKEKPGLFQKVIFQKADGSSPLADLHPSVQKTAATLFENGHFRQAILDTYIALNLAVKDKSGLIDLDNTPLMRRAFSPRNPALIISSDSGEQEGFMSLYAGAMLAIRNPKAHSLVDQSDPQRALEWLSFASVLFKILDDAQPDI